LIGRRRADRLGGGGRVPPPRRRLPPTSPRSSGTRRDGFLANGRRRAKLALCRRLLDTQPPPPPPPIDADYRERYRRLTGHALDICPYCGGAMRSLSTSPPSRPRRRRTPHDLSRRPRHHPSDNERSCERSRAPLRRPPLRGRTPLEAPLEPAAIKAVGHLVTAFDALPPRDNQDARLRPPRTPRSWTGRSRLKSHSRGSTPRFSSIRLQCGRAVVAARLAPRDHTEPSRFRRRL
jgi:hypothetical protein